MLNKLLFLCLTFICLNASANSMIGEAVTLHGRTGGSVILFNAPNYGAGRVCESIDGSKASIKDEFNKGEQWYKVEVKNGNCKSFAGWTNVSTLSLS